jgi:predicted negative regulator of RcsB-dependent stress response
MRIAIAAVVILLAGWFGYDYYQTQQEEKAAIAAAEAAAAEAAAAEAAAAEAEAAAAAEATAAAAAEAAAALEAAAQEAAAAAQAALDAAAAQLDPDNLIAKIEASSLSVVEKNLFKAFVEAAGNSPELLQGAADQVAEKIGS